MQPAPAEQSSSEQRQSRHHIGGDGQARGGRAARPLACPKCPVQACLDTTHSARADTTLAARLWVARPTARPMPPTLAMSGPTLMPAKRVTGVAGELWQVRLVCKHWYY